MHQLIYISDKASPLKPLDIENILSISRKNNQNKNITGLLLELPEHFIQVLEGQKQRIEAVYQRICEDKRHHNVRLVSTTHSLAKEFGEWSMGFSDNLNDMEIKDIIHVINAFSKKKQFNKMQSDGLHLLLKSLV